MLIFIPELRDYSLYERAIIQKSENYPKTNGDFSIGCHQYIRAIGVSALV
jgi:hypothetical protein